MDKLFVVLLILVSACSIAYGNDVLGCGGFILSHVPIDFSKVVMKLYTKQGILKDQTNCAPNNGYYFIPLYDKGDYILQLEPPPGWSFTPTNVSLTIDGKTDPCSQGKDINFLFWGFGITGKVESYGSVDGPPGIEVQLVSEKETRETTTGATGEFFFTPVFPGDYTITIKHYRWQVLKNSLKVIVTEGNTELPANSLMIAGYDVTGYVGSQGMPVTGAKIFLYSENKNALVRSCDKNIPKDTTFDKKTPLCFATSDANGNFVFKSVSNGEYFIVPYYKDPKIHFEPLTITFKVNHDSILLQEKFEIVGFSVTGRVVDGEGGKPIAGATVMVDNQYMGSTKVDGSYRLEKIKVGTYTIQISTENYKFDSVVVRVNPSITQLTPLHPSAYKICGNVVSDRAESVQVLITNTANNQQIATTSDSNSGEFCEYLSKGTYTIKIDLQGKEQGLQFFPPSQKVEVTRSPIFDITFSQLKAVVTGQMKCIRPEDCSSIKILMSTASPDHEENVVGEIIDGRYSFKDILPGSYKLYLTHNNLCWNIKEQLIVVTSAVHTVPTFVHNGYAVTFISSHDSKVTYVAPGLKPQKKTVAVTKGTSTHCLLQAGAYEFTISSCHTYESNTVKFNTNESTEEVVLTALKHLNQVGVSAERDFGPLTISVTIGGIKTLYDPLTYQKGMYVLSLSLSSGENAILVPHSEILYFNPPILLITGDDDCSDLGIRFEAKKGRVFKGRINPPLQGVQITIESENSDSLIDETDDNGFYKFPPLDDSKNYKIIAKKDSYVLLGPDEHGNFLAHKLAEILVEVIDQNDNTPLQGALLSLTGGESYRSNLQTNERGRIMFSSLSPSEYFLKPMMKEYNFEPASKIINVQVGASVKIQLKGKRVAYSAYGQVTSLNNQPEERMILIASGVDNCSQYSEEATSESNGSFRIRGLLPYCSYDIKVKGSLDENDVIERAAPETIRVSQITQDVRNIHLIVFRSSLTTDVLLKVFTSNIEHYKNLRVKISRESAPAGVVHTIKVDPTNYKVSSDNNIGVVVQVPAIALDKKSYSIQLESSTVTLNKGKPQMKLFVADTSFKYIEMEFVVKSNVTDQHIKQTSVWTLVFIFGSMAAAYNIQKIVSLVRDKVPVANVEAMWKAKPPVAEYIAQDNDDIDQIVESINAPKKKVKSKRI